MSIESFIQYFNRCVTRVVVLPKTSSNFMLKLGDILNIASAFGITDINKAQFLSQYTTTIGDTIYSNILTVESAPSPLMIHELCHILQFLYKKMPIQYVVSRQSRAYYESEAIQATMLAFPETFNSNYIDKRVLHLKAYGIPARVAELAIRDRIGEVERNKVPDRPRRVNDALRAWRDQ